MKRVYCLYRVSTERQVEKNDIPMQRQACHEFAYEKGWSIEKEFYEKGVSGFKISANDRDAIQYIKCAATRNEFDILLVFMFDRLGRRDDETPFVVEWFVKNGIAVWSAKEGEQRFDTHVDKLLNYIQFWQASGESLKTSIRTRTRIEQLTREGYYTGGTAPYGYRLVRCGRLNRENQEVSDLEIDSAHADVVRLIYQKYVTEGMGTYRIARYLTERSIPSATATHWHAQSIARILQNPIYTGVLHKGMVTSDAIPALHIIENALFESAQQQRRSYMDQKTAVRRPYQTENMLCLLGLVYCAHCGKRLIRGTSGKQRMNQNGEMVRTTRQRYICSTRQTHPNLCNGQSGYGAMKLEDAVVTQVVATLNDFQNNAFWQTALLRYDEEIAIEQSVCSGVEARIAQKVQDLADLQAEIISALRGTSELGLNLLRRAIEHTEAALQKERQHLQIYEGAVSLTKKRKGKFEAVIAHAEQYEAVLMTGDSHSISNLLYAIIRRIEVGRGCTLNIDYHFSGYPDPADCTESLN